MVYKWKTGFWKVKPEVAGEVFEQLENTVGLTSQNVVDASRPEDAPLHNEFEWRDDVAAEKYRCQQASMMIAALTITMPDIDEDVSTRAYVTLTPKTKEGQFENIRSVMEVSEKRDALLERAKNDMKIFKTKYAILKELAGVFAEMDKLI